MILAARLALNFAMAAFSDPVDPNAKFKLKFSSRLFVRPGAAAPLAKVTGMIVTVRVRLRAAAGCKAPPSRPAQRKFCGV